MDTLWVMRHGLAESHFDTDFNRALSSVGEQQAANVAKKIVAEQAELPEKMLVSPFRRTQETARVIQPILGLNDDFETEDMLVHYGDHQILGDYLMTLEADKVIIVSHMPIVANLCQYLAPSANIFGFQTAQVAKLKFVKGVGELESVILAQ